MRQELSSGGLVRERSSSQIRDWKGPVDRVVASVIPEGIQGASSAQKRGFKMILKAGRHGDVPSTNSMRARS
jgi:hypothetical protein